uniref:THAP-type domain-containing protein n=1 Tax=Pygocentrus nattereri TaxID=42514 RepID=A0A3B4BVB3_PYGNA
MSVLCCTALKEGYLQQWIANMGKPEGWTPSESSVLCSAHFSPECFDGSAHLLPDAIPTVFSPAEFMVRFYWLVMPPH